MSLWESKTVRMKDGEAAPGDTVWVVTVQRPGWDDQPKIDGVFVDEQNAKRRVHAIIDVALENAVAEIPAIVVGPAVISDPVRGE